MISPADSRPPRDGLSLLTERATGFSLVPKRNRHKLEAQSAQVTPAFFGISLRLKESSSENTQNTPSKTVHMCSETQHLKAVLEAIRQRDIVHGIRFLKYWLCDKSFVSKPRSVVTGSDLLSVVTVSDLRTMLHFRAHIYTHTHTSDYNIT